MCKLALVFHQYGRSGYTDFKEIHTHVQREGICVAIYGENVDILILIIYFEVISYFAYNNNKSSGWVILNNVPKPRELIFVQRQMIVIIT